MGLQSPVWACVSLGFGGLRQLTSGCNVQVVGGVQLRLQGAGVMTIIAVLPAEVEKTLISRVCAWERRLSGPRRTLAAAQLWKRS